MNHIFKRGNPKQDKKQPKTPKSPAGDMARPAKGTEPRPLPGWFDAAINLRTRFQRFGRDVFGVVLIAVASMTLLGLIGLTSGAWLTPWATFLRRWLGLGSFIVVAGFGVIGLLMMRQKEELLTAKDWGRVISLEIASVAFMALLSIVGGVSFERAVNGLDGGLVGWGMSELVGLLLSPLPDLLMGFFRVAIFVFIVLVGIVFGFGLLGKAIFRLEALVAESDLESDYEPFSDQPAISVGEMPSAKQTSVEKKRQIQRERRFIPQEHRKTFKIEDQESDRPAAPIERDDRLPDLAMLVSDKGIKVNERHINQTAGLIEKTLAEFGVPSKVVGFKVGPTITQFAVEPGYLQKGVGEDEENRQKVRVSQISGLQRDLTLALSAQRLRIQAPVPGRSYVGIEVPNDKASQVRLRSILETEDFQSVDSPLALALGRDVSGLPVTADLARMPHLLIAGTTGSGKSVCISALTACLAMNNTPEKLRLVMVDPKMVELVRFNGLPHLYGKVETQLERINTVLRWAVVEMERRYKLLEEMRARDINSYNNKVARRKDLEKLPYIVLMIDELADLMMSAAEQTEATLVRLAQKARAIGIHLVVATQRPSTDVVTGLIKANFPARLSFAVASGVDSRVILDGPGAESLLGRGDMLFLAPEAGNPVRAQGVMVSDQELEAIIDYWQEQWQPEDLNEIQDSPWERMVEAQEILADRDDLVMQAIEAIKETGMASASFLQRRLRIGYPRAARLVDELEDLGVLGPSQGGGRSREILISVDEEDDDGIDF